MSPKLPTSRSAGLLSCSSCHLLSVAPRGDRRAAACPRCGAYLHPRKVNSLSRTWALLLAAVILYLPANLLPIMITTSLGDRQADTIISGVIYFVKTGSWPIALIIFVASICVPLVKLVVLAFLLISVQRGWRWRPRDRTRIYRMTEAVGRWSMVDIYAVAILVALVRMGAIATVEAGPGIGYFAAVVIMTMLAARSFDPRLIWDAVERQS